MKTCTLLIESCAKCPHHIVDLELGKTPWPQDICTAMNDKSLREYPKIPSDCPLQDAAKTNP